MCSPAPSCRSARLRLAVDLLREEVERARVGPGSEQQELLAREARVDVLPVVDLRTRRPDLLQLLDGEALGPRVRLVDDDRDAVVRDRERHPLDALVLARL